MRAVLTQDCESVNILGVSIKTYTAWHARWFDSHRKSVGCSIEE